MHRVGYVLMLGMFLIKSGKSLSANELQGLTLRPSRKLHDLYSFGRRLALKSAPTRFPREANHESRVISSAPLPHRYLQGVC